MVKQVVVRPQDGDIATALSIRRDHAQEARCRRSPRAPPRRARRTRTTVAAHPRVSPRARAPRPTARRRRRRRRRRRPRAHPTARITRRRPGLPQRRGRVRRHGSRARSHRAVHVRHRRPNHARGCGTRRSWAGTSRRCSTPSKPRSFDRRDERRLDRVTNPRRDLCVVGHSAGGWLARLWIARRAETRTARFTEGPRVKTLLTLGTPHELPRGVPIPGRVPEQRQRASSKDGFERFECRGPAEGAEGPRVPRARARCGPREGAHEFVIADQVLDVLGRAGSSLPRSVRGDAGPPRPSSTSLIFFSPSEPSAPSAPSAPSGRWRRASARG